MSGTIFGIAYMLVDGQSVPLGNTFNYSEFDASYESKTGLDGKVHGFSYKPEVPFVEVELMVGNDPVQGPPGAQLGIA